MKSAAGIAFSFIGKVLLAGLIGAFLVWLAPGLDSSEQQLDMRLSKASQDTLRHQQNLFAQHLNISRTFGRPVNELLTERIPVTAKEVGMGLCIGWGAAIALALSTILVQRRTYHLAATGLAATTLCVPHALLALLLFMLKMPAGAAIAAVVFPKAFRHLYELFRDGATAPHVVAAAARGVGVLRLIGFHVIPPALPQALALMGISVNVALGAAIPIEALCDVPGIGQLAWKAALGRDLPVLIQLTLLITAVTLAANAVADLMIQKFERVQP
jgi:peptide/nickel transport system permease protein